MLALGYTNIYKYEIHIGYSLFSLGGGGGGGGGKCRISHQKNWGCLVFIVNIFITLFIRML